VRKSSWVIGLLMALGCSSGGAVAPNDAAVEAGEARDAVADAAPDDRPAPRPPLPSLDGPPVLEDHTPDPAIVEVDLTAQEFQTELVAGQPTAVLGFNGRSPGPVLQARVGDRVIVHFHNGLDEPTTLHWHGLRIPSAMDGNPMVQDPIPAGGDFTYDFVVPDAGTFWYHPHVNTIVQLDRGLYGAIVVHEAAPPRYAAERVMVLDDVRVDARGDIAPFATSGHDVVHGRAGNLLLLNGATALAARTSLHGAVERWRLVNAAGSRVFSVRVEGASWRVIGTDGGLLPTPLTLPRLSIAPGQRFDLEVRYDQPDAPRARLLTDVLSQTADGTVQTVARPMAAVTLDGDAPMEPPTLPTVTLPPPAETPVEQTIRLGAISTPTSLVFTINGHAHDAPMLTFTQGAPVRFTIVNEIAPEHPFHLHGQFFQVLTRNGRDAREPGWKDTVQLGAMERVTIETRFENPGRWMYHCHIPEHAENGMMAELEVTPSP
jgi:FtsP/CotA-like multicopper oxidase with cupredoxin domain